MNTPFSTTKDDKDIINGLEAVTTGCYRIIRILDRVLGKYNDLGDGAGGEEDFRAESLLVIDIYR